jgi:limonene-1,2-epoxide hydrolase
VATPVEIFQAAVDALNRTDKDELERLIDPEIVFVPLRAAVTGPFIGYKGLEDFLAENAERFDLFKAEFDEVRALPDGRVLAIGYIRMRNKGGKVDSRYLTAGIAAFRDDRMCSWRDYGSVDAALAAAGEPARRPS